MTTTEYLNNTSAKYSDTRATAQRVLEATAEYDTRHGNYTVLNRDKKHQYYIRRSRQIIEINTIDPQSRVINTDDEFNLVGSSVSILHHDGEEAYVSWSSGKGAENAFNLIYMIRLAYDIARELNNA